MPCLKHRRKKVATLSCMGVPNAQLTSGMKAMPSRKFEK